MNDIHEASENFHAILYADDTSLFSSFGSFNVSLNGNNFDKHVLSTNINNELRKIQEWLYINKLSLNVSKTKYIIFHNHQRNIDSLIPDIRINNQAIERVSEFNFLGLTIDEHLSWNAHIKKISNKVAKSIGILNRLKRYMPPNILRTLYSALILHVEPLLKQLNLLKVSDIFHNSLLKLFYKYKSGNFPHYIMHIFSDATSTHDYNTRSHKILGHPTTHLYGSEKCVRYQLPRVIEKADPNILEKVNTHCYTGFCLYLRRISVQNYKSECSQRNCYTYQNRD